MSSRELPPNSVLVTCIASIGKNAILKKMGSCNQQINAIIPNNDHDANFIYYLMENSKNYLLSNAGITATNIISKKVFREMVFSFPSKAEQQAIANILSVMDAEISALEQRRDKTLASETRNDAGTTYRQNEVEMSTVGQIERATQNRVVKLLHEQLGYTYLGNWEVRQDNSNIEERYLRTFLKRQGYNDTLIKKALYELTKVSGDQARSLYDINKDVYGLLRYGVQVRPDVGENTETVSLIDWKKPLDNDFAVAQEVTVEGEHTKRPDVVLYVNGIALGVLELKRSVVSVSEGIRQNLDNQKKIFIQPFFTTMQLIMAGNDTEGLRYGVIETPEKYYLTWKEKSAIENHLDRALTQLCEKRRFLEMIHDFVVFDAGVKKISRHNQYLGVREAQERVRKREGGIIWHTQGSGKSLTMVWLCKVDSRECAGFPCPDHHRSHRTGRADRESIQGRRRRHLSHEKWTRPHQ